MTNKGSGRTPRFIEQLDAVAAAVAGLERRVAALEGTARPTEAATVTANLVDLGDRLQRLNSEFNIHRSRHDDVSPPGRGSVR